MIVAQAKSVIQQQLGVAAGPVRDAQRIAVGGNARRGRDHHGPMSTSSRVVVVVTGVSLFGMKRVGQILLLVIAAPVVIAEIQQWDQDRCAGRTGKGATGHDGQGVAEFRPGR